MHNTSDKDQLHSFWITLWNFISSFLYVLSREEVQKAMTSINSPKKHPFWEKFREALWTLVSIPKEMESSGYLTKGHLPAISTKEWLQKTIIEIPAGLKNEFYPEQPKSQHGTRHVRYIYSNDDLEVLGNITKFFPGFDVTPYDFRSGHDGIPLQRIEQFVWLAKQNPDESIINSSSVAIFFVRGRKGLIMVRLWEKLGTWRMERVEAGDHFRSTYVYVIY